MIKCAESKESMERVLTKMRNYELESVIKYLKVLKGMIKLRKYEKEC